ncbi:MAG: Gfo/Idh/MocA family oxidoreductase [Clostridia bacterium]|nr:Gfo/Idh/MocA family oxidoreductase [Clostridia bacterium]
MQTFDAKQYIPSGVPTPGFGGRLAPVVKPGEFVFSAAHLDHEHIFGMCMGLVAAGGTIKYVYDTNEKKIAQMQRMFPNITVVDSEEKILEDKDTILVAAAAIPNERGPFGIRVMNAGKDYFTDKAPFTTLEQLAEAREVVKKTGRKYAVCYSERLGSECAILAGYMIDAGEIGDVLSVSGFGPHLLRPQTRAPWFFEKEKYGGILCDIGSHQVEQYLYYTGEKSATVTASRIANYAHPQWPELDDFGDCYITGANGTTNYFRVDWFTPDGLRTWGDGRTLILGTKGYIEMRKYINVGVEPRGGNHMFLVNGSGERYINATGMTGTPYYGQLILDCLNRTENAMTQEHCFMAAQLCLEAQAQAVKVK